MSLLILAVPIVAVAICFFLYKKKQKDAMPNIFMKMNCTGVPDERALTEKEKHDILRQDFHPSTVGSGWDVIIIGSGLSGLTTAKVLAAGGKKVLVLEQHDRAGGACHTFDLEQYEFDVGLHYVQGMAPGKKLHRICSALTESQAQWEKMEEPFDVAMIGANKYGRIAGGSDQFREQLKEWFPKEADNIDAYFKYAQKCLTTGVPLMFVSKFAPLPFVRFLINSGIFSLLSKLFKYDQRTLLEVMNEYNFSKELQCVIGYYFVNYGAPPNRASFLQHSMFLMDSGYYPIGGVGTVTANAVRSIEKFGGKVLCKANIKQISFDRGVVNGVIVEQGKNGCFVGAPLVISTAPITHTFNDLIPSEIAKQSAMYGKILELNSADKVKLAGFQAYIGLSGTKEELNLPSNNYFTFKTNDVLETDKYIALSREEAIEYGCPPFMYICFPSAKDPAWNERHPGVSTCQLITGLNPNLFEQYRDKSKRRSQKRTDKDDYVDLKNTFGEHMIDQLLKVFPNLRDKIAFTEFSSPLSQQYFMQNSYGELYSLAHQLQKFAPAHWSELRCTTDIPGLYLSGQDVLFCGVSSALINGMMTAGTILNINADKCLKAAYKAQTAALESRKTK